MADETGRSPIGARQAPDFLTVSQTALVLQLGRSTTYGLVGRFVETGGVEGIPAVLVGGQYRVPRARIEEMTGGPLTWPPAPRERGTRPGRASDGGAVGSPRPASEPQSAALAVEEAGVALVRDLRPPRLPKDPALPTPTDGVDDLEGVGGGAPAGDLGRDDANAPRGEGLRRAPQHDGDASSSSGVWSQSSLPFAG
jgi:hypothetical protein